jgi:hypothetical protein
MIMCLEGRFAMVSIHPRRHGKHYDKAQPQETAASQALIDHKQATLNVILPLREGGVTGRDPDS